LNHWKGVNVPRDISALLCLLLVSLATNTVGVVLAGETCRPQWSDAFTAGGPNGLVRAVTVFDDGSGPALFVGGMFTQVADVNTNGIAKWDGSSWSAVGSGLGGSTDLFVAALTVHDDGTGPALYAGGLFETMDGVAANRVARWDGTTWTPLGSGIGGGSWKHLLAMASFDDGTGPALYVGGSFTQAGGVSISNFARWQNDAWSTVAEGPNIYVRALEVFDDGNGPALYVGGDGPGSDGTNGVVRWDGVGWSLVGEPFAQRAWEQVNALEIFDDKTGPALYAGGDFDLGNGDFNLAKWDGQAWIPATPALHWGQIHSLYSHSDGEETSLYAGGEFINIDGNEQQARIAKWDGTQWSSLGMGIADQFTYAGFYGSTRVYAINSFDDGTGESLIVAGSFYGTGHANTHNIAAWDGEDWSALEGYQAIKGDSLVMDIMVADVAGETGVYACGQFGYAGDGPANHIAQWDGSGWIPLGSGLTGGNLDEHDEPKTIGYAMATYDAGSGPELYVGGYFTEAGGLTANSIARWNGAAWQPAGDGLGGTSEPTARAMAVFEDGAGTALYVGGLFQTAGGIDASHVARWDGSNWSTVGDVIRPLDSSQPGVRTMAIFDDGGGQALCVGGDFEWTDGSATRYLAKWDGFSWMPLGSSDVYPNGPVNTMAVFDDGAGAALYVGGSFDHLGELAVDGIAKWDGTAWHGVARHWGGATQQETIHILTVFDDGPGPSLFAGGVMTDPDTGLLSLARWDGADWSFPMTTEGTIFSLAGWNMADKPHLFVGGAFTNVSGTPSVQIAEGTYTDADADGWPDSCDNCLAIVNADQQDTDDDGAGNVCDDDDDNDGLLDDVDNCPIHSNPSQTDSDDDVTGDACDLCPNTIPGAVMAEFGCPVPIPGDLDRDGDVDQTDFGLFQQCLSGADVPQEEPACESALLDEDNDVDANDFGIFQVCISGPNIPADPNCAD